VESANYTGRVGDWYTIGLAAGVGAGLGVVLAGLLGTFRFGAVIGTLVAAVLGAVIGAALIGDSVEGVAGAIGGLLGGLGAAQVVAGASRRGGTATGLGLLVGAAGVVICALAFVPLLGYVAALVVPVLGVRVRRRTAERYAGLRTLAK
jgi:hypothetical protein